MTRQTGARRRTAQPRLAAWARRNVAGACLPRSPCGPGYPQRRWPRCAAGPGGLGQRRASPSASGPPGASLLVVLTGPWCRCRRMAAGFDHGHRVVARPVVPRDGVEVRCPRNTPGAASPLASSISASLPSQARPALASSWRRARRTRRWRNWAGCRAPAAARRALPPARRPRRSASARRAPAELAR